MPLIKGDTPSSKRGLVNRPYAELPASTMYSIYTDRSQYYKVLHSSIVENPASPGSLTTILLFAEKILAWPRRTRAKL